MRQKAFTLIELLVVVLIIGILAAVAVPQYKKAVDRSRLTELITSLNAIGKAQEVYYLANGNYSKDFSELDLALTSGAQGYETTVGTQTYKITFYNGGILPYAWATDSKIPNLTLYFFYNQHHLWPNKYACYAVATDSYANSLCKTVSGKTTRDTQISDGPKNVYLF